MDSIHFYWTNATTLLKNASVGDLNMADIAVGVLFVLASASLYGLAVYLFRDQIWRRSTTQMPIAFS